MEQAVKVLVMQKNNFVPFVRWGDGDLSVMGIYHSESLAVDSGH
jgi:hypothetical protein